MKKTLGLATMALSLSAGAATIEHVPGELLLKIKDGKINKVLSQKMLHQIDLKEIIKTDSGSFALVRVPQTKSIKSIASDLMKNDQIEYAEPNYIYKAIDSVETLESKLYNTRTALNYSASLTDDPRFGDLWGLRNLGDNEPAGRRGNSSPEGKVGVDINAMAAWEMTKGDHKVKIAVIDTGVDYNHEDLKNNMWVNQAELNGEEGVDDDNNGYIDDIHGYDFANDDGDPMDGNGHGTHCSGTIAAEHNNGVGVAGVMAKAQIVAIKFLTDQGSGTTADAIKAIDYATKMNVDIMSNSWGGGGASELLLEAIQNASKKGIVFTAAAGNSAGNNDDSPHYPSNYDVENVIAVAAHNYNDKLANFSCYGKQTVHVAAPGRNILSTTQDNSYSVFSGTSMATPHVSGVIGLYIAQNGRTDLKDLRDNLMKSSVYTRSYEKKTIGGGRVDAYNFLNHVEAARPMKPSPDAWVSSNDFSLETEHPYANSIDITKTIHVPNAKFIRVNIKKFVLENVYDYILIKNTDGETVEKITGDGEDYKTDYIFGDTLILEFHSDSSVNKWGFVIDGYDYIL